MNNLFCINISFNLSVKLMLRNKKKIKNNKKQTKKIELNKFTAYELSDTTNISFDIVIQSLFSEKSV